MAETVKLPCEWADGTTFGLPTLPQVHSNAQRIEFLIDALRQHGWPRCPRGGFVSISVPQCVDLKYRVNFSCPLCYRHPEGSDT